MHPIARKLGGILVAGALTAAVLTGCGSTSTVNSVGQPDCLTGSALVLVVPTHQDAQAPGVPQQWDCALDAAIRRGLPISVVTAEGKPRVLVRGLRAAVTTDNPDAANDDVAAAKNTIIAGVASAGPASNGDDLLAALSLAADLAPGGQILSSDNGAADTGVVRTTDAGMTTVVDPVDVAQLVQDRGACPAVKGTRVELYGLGYQVAPGEPLSTRQRTRVTQTWESVLTACGANVQTVALPRTGVGPGGPFTAVAITPEAEPVMPTAASTPSRTCQAVLPDSVVGFVADKATFLAPDDARKLIASVATGLTACPGTVEVVGTTSSAGTEQGRAALSKARADAVRELLAQAMGIPAAAITARGLGYDTSANGGCVIDRVDGVLAPVLAAQNRKVMIRVIS